MERLFYKKSTAIMVVAFAMVLVLLVCMLLVTLTQLSSLNERKNYLKQLVDAAQTDEAAKQELLDYKNSDAYVIEWAKYNNLLSESDINYIESLDSGK